MLINANELIKTQTDTIKAESQKMLLSQSVLCNQHRSLVTSEDAMISYLGGNITMLYQELEEYVQTKMELLCSVIEGAAYNNTSFATEAEEIDIDAGNKVVRGE